MIVEQRGDRDSVTARITITLACAFIGGLTKGIAAFIPGAVAGLIVAGSLQVACGVTRQILGVDVGRPIGWAAGGAAGCSLCLAAFVCLMGHCNCFAAALLAGAIFGMTCGAASGSIVSLMRVLGTNAATGPPGRVRRAVWVSVTMLTASVVVVATAITPSIASEK